MSNPDPYLGADSKERLAAAAVAARENNASDQFTDGLNRHWFVGCANVDNRSHVLIQVRQGQHTRESYLSTATFNPEAVEAAIAELHGSTS